MLLNGRRPVVARPGDIFHQTRRELSVRKIRERFGNIVARRFHGNSVVLVEIDARGNVAFAKKLFLDTFFILCVSYLVASLLVRLHDKTRLAIRISKRRAIFANFETIFVVRKIVLGVLRVNARIVILQSAPFVFAASPNWPRRG